MNVYDPSALGLHVTKRIGRHELQCLCPYHDDTKPSAQYNIEKQLFYCFTCKETRSAKEVADDLGGELIFVTADSVVSFEYDEGEDSEWKNIIFMNRIAKDNAYLKGRNVSNDQISKYIIKESRDGVIFPLLDKFEDISGALIRHYEKVPKYYFYGNKPLFWPYSSLYNQGDMIITEGVFGALRAESAGFNSAAILGTNSILSVARMLVSNRHIKPVFWLDPDFAGYLAMGKFALLGFQVLLHDENIDEMKPKLIKKVFGDQSKKTYNVMDVINKFDGDYERLQLALEKFWSKIN